MGQLVRGEHTTWYGYEGIHITVSAFHTWANVVLGRSFPPLLLYVKNLSLYTELQPHNRMVGSVYEQNKQTNKPLLLHTCD